MTSKEHRLDGECFLAVQVVCRGNLDSKVLAVAAPASKNGTAHVVVRVGRTITYVEDRQALEAFTSAWRRASELGQQVFPAEPDGFAWAEAQARRRFEKSPERP